MPIELVVVTPEGEAFSGLVEEVVLPGVEGEFGVLEAPTRRFKIRFDYKGKRYIARVRSDRTTIELWISFHSARCGFEPF